MNEIYRVKIHGKTLESRNLRVLLARAVSEKRNMDRVFRLAGPRLRAQATAQIPVDEVALAADF